MKALILKTTFFTAPFALLYLFCLLFYSNTETPDLLRLGSIPNLDENYHQKFEFRQNVKYDSISNVLYSINKKKKYTILTIGDSFSEQENLGYKNFLAQNFSVLHIDRFISNNQIQTLINLLNGDFFDKYDIKYVILQNVERLTIENVKNISLQDKMTLSQIDSLIKLRNDKYKQINKKDTKQDFFSKRTIKFPLYDFPKFLFSENYLSDNSVFNVEINSELFSNNLSKLLFLNYDLVQSTQNNNLKNIDSLNIVLNIISQKLSQRNISLIFLPSPDKYDLYYEFIVDKDSFTKPVFFDIMKNTKKEYIYIDSKEILLSQIEKKDLYFYDDTHWSPISAEIIANKIQDIIQNR